ncbi:ATP-grasp domain-containing protein [Tumidithrix elongata RA019]|uniref:ATP-grasp domain-containing protein n=1 Tax=Tumidithrix elongata BACA0141 TaxID=2716417 RepID=A0AAW9PV68_9CYAN|nr:ATP-grasp domain-containing protein [Tumidithrix elongata RA019]
MISANIGEGARNSTITVLVTGVGAIIGQGIIKSLRRSHYPLRIVGIDRSDQSPGPLLCDVFHKKPICDELEPTYLDFWNEILQKEGVDIVLPGLELDVFFLNGQRDLLKQAGARLALNHHNLIELSTDKWQLGEELTRHGLPCIPTRLIVDSWQDAVSQLGTPPLLLKPRRGNGSRGIVRLCDETDFHYWYRRNNVKDAWLLQRIVGDDNEEYTVGLFGLGNGQALPSITFRRRLSTAGNTQAAVVVDDPVIEAFVQSLTKLFQPLGPTNFQFRKEGEGAYLLEINPRFSSSTSLRAAFGYNEAEMSLDFFLFDKIPESPQIRYGMAWRYSEDFVTYDCDPI